ncbi:hypothetical protein ACRAVF_27055 [Bradyrhizobium oligotrophicum S58]
MTDLLDLAKGPRDAALAELDRILPGHPPMSAMANVSARISSRS